MSEQALWGEGSGAALWAKMLDISRDLQPQFDALASLAATFSELLWLGGQAGSPAERITALLARRLPVTFSDEPLHHLLPEQVACGQGQGAITLAVWACAVGEQAGIDLYPVCFPGGVLLAVMEGETQVLIEPVTACRCSERHLNALVRATLGSWASRQPEHSQRPNERTVLLRWLLELRAVLIATARWQGALQVVNTHLQLAANDPYARRDRGYILDQLDCGELARADFEGFIKACPKDPSSPLLRERLRQLAGQRMVRH